MLEILYSEILVVVVSTQYSLYSFFKLVFFVTNFMRAEIGQKITGNENYEEKYFFPTYEENCWSFREEKFLYVGKSEIEKSFDGISLLK